MTTSSNQNVRVFLMEKEPQDVYSVLIETGNWVLYSTALQGSFNVIRHIEPNTEFFSDYWSLRGDDKYVNDTVKAQIKRISKHASEIAFEHDEVCITIISYGRYKGDFYVSFMATNLEPKDAREINVSEDFSIHQTVRDQ